MLRPGRPPRLRYGRFTLAANYPGGGSPAILHLRSWSSLSWAL